MQIDINLTRTAADLITEFGAGAKLYLYSSATEGGAYGLVGSGTLLVSGTERYEIFDAAGTPGTTWYKFRAGDSTAVTFGAYSDPWLSTSLTAYATLDDVRETLALGTDTTRDNLLTDLIGDVSMAVDVVCGRQFYRSPQVTGTETFYLDVRRSGMRTLSLATLGAGCSDGKALDIVSITNLYVRDSESGSYVEISAGDTGYYLLPGDGPGAAGTVWPYEDIELSSAASRTTWPVGHRSIKIIGVRGFASVPSPIKRAVISEVRNRFRAGVAGGYGGVASEAPVGGDDTEWLRVTFPPYVKRSWGAV